MKKLLAVLLITLSYQLSAQRKIGSQGCAEMWGDSDVDTRGCWYYAYIKNECETPIFVDKSNFKTRFRYSKVNSKGEVKYSTENKNIKFPGVFLAGNSSITRDRKRNDSSSKTYTSVLWRTAEMGKVYKCHSEKPTPDAIEIALNARTFIGTKDGVNFYVQLNKASDNWPGFQRYKVSLLADNPTSEKVKVGAEIEYTVYFHGINFAGELKVASVKANSFTRKSEKENPVFNFIPKVYIVVKKSNINMTGAGTSTAAEDLDGESENGEELETEVEKAPAGPVMRTKTINGGAKFVYSNQPKDENTLITGTLLSTNGDTLLSGIASYVSNGKLYGFDDRTRMYETADLDESELYIPVDGLDDTKGAYYYNPKTDKLEKYVSIDLVKIGSVYYLLCKETATSPIVLKDLTAGKELNQFKYKEMNFMRNNAQSITDVLFVAENLNGQQGIVNAFNQEKTKFHYSLISPRVKNGLIMVYKPGTNSALKVNKLCGFLDINFKEVIPCKYDYLQSIPGGYFIVWNKLKVKPTGQDSNQGWKTHNLESFETSIMDSTGKLLVPFERLGFIHSDGNKNGFNITVSKKPVINIGEISVELKGGIVSYVSYEINALKFQDDRPVKEFTDINEFLLYAE